MNYEYQSKGHKQTIVGLHGTGDNAAEFLEFVQQVAPSHNILSLEGDVMVRGLRRFAGVNPKTGFIDEQDMFERLDTILATIKEALGDVDPKDLILLGYSNGANAVSALLLAGKSPASQHILLRPMNYETPPTTTSLENVKIDIYAGTRDRLIPIDNVTSLYETFQVLHADVNLFVTAASHQLAYAERAKMKTWFESQV